MTKFQPLQKIHKLYLDNPVSKFIEITCSEIFRQKFKTIRVYKCTYVLKSFNHNNSYKFHDHIRVHKFYLDKPDSMFFEISRRLTFGQSFRKLILSKCPNVWPITMIWRIFMTFREYVRVRKMYLDNQLSRGVEISWRYPFR